ncbi:hypothetical protein MKW98_007055 [Papaver atlanticum]|uniref:Uncharacterized protein n=1 Tax=Papaver atlanticum TaxID=357466 RepID=A0AAD4STJ3_9MAGN|nr:hypothetical protein MKW98_007055 [Papaver atlanticum]
MDSENKLLETMRDIKRIFQLYQDQNSSNSPTLDEDRLVFKRVINNLMEHAIQTQVKTYEEQYFKSPPKKCPNCGKMKKAGRQVVIAMDAARRFAYFGKHPQQPSSVQLVDGSGTNNGHSGIQQKSVAIVPKFQLGQETVDALERQSKKMRLSREYLPQRKKKVGPSRQRYNNSFNDVILAPTLMQFDQGVVSTFSDSSSCSESRSRSRSISPARSATSLTGSISPSRYQRTSSWESTYSTYSTGSIAPNTSYNEREPRSRGRKLDHPRRCRSISRSRSSRSTSRSRSPNEVYSNRRSRDSNVHPSNHSADKGDDHHHPGRHNTGVSSPKEDETVHAHHRSIANPVNNGTLHRKSNDQMVRKNKRRTQVRNEPKQHGHLRKLFGGVLGHFRGSNKSKPSTVDKRRLERALTCKRNVVVKVSQVQGVQK